MEINCQQLRKKHGKFVFDKVLIPTLMFYKGEWCVELSATRKTYVCVFLDNPKNGVTIDVPKKCAHKGCVCTQFKMIVPLSSINTPKEMVWLHEMVAQRIPNPENHPYIEHINGDILDNRKDNLRWTPNEPEGYNDDRYICSYV